MTPNHLIVTLQSWSFEECGTFNCLYFKVHSSLVVPVKVPCMGQIELVFCVWHWIELSVLNSHMWNHLTACKLMSTALFKILPTNYLFPNHIYNIYAIKSNQQFPMNSCIKTSVQCVLWAGLFPMYLHNTRKSTCKILLNYTCVGGISMVYCLMCWIDCLGFIAYQLL